MSDRRLKNIGSRFEGGLDEINQLKVYNYIYKDDKSKNKHTGVIAQDLLKVFPNSVFSDDKGFLSIRWDEMFYASINAIKELNLKIASLFKQTFSLEAKLQKLEAENSELNSKIETLSKRIEKLKQ